MKKFVRLINFLALGLLLGFASAKLHAQDLFVSEVRLNGDQHVELLPDDPIIYTVFYGRSSVSAPPPNGPQRFRVSVYLTTDGNPDNPNNYLIDFFDSTGAEAGSAGAPLPPFTASRRLTNALPRNFTGTYFLIATIRVTGGTADPGPTINTPAVFTTGTARVTIRPADMPTTDRVSTNTAGSDANEYSESPSVSADGRYVVFHSEATNVVSSPSVPAGVAQIYLRDNLNSTTTLISQLGNVPGNAESRFPVISSDGRFVAYQSAATNLISGVGNTDTNGQTDIFVYEVNTGINSRISVNTTATQSPGNQGNGGSFLPAINSDGSIVAFESVASNLTPGDTNSRRDVFYTRLGYYSVAGEPRFGQRRVLEIRPASVTASGVFGNNDSTQVRISDAVLDAANGVENVVIAFRSYATNLVPGKTTTTSEIYTKVIDSVSLPSQLGRITRVSLGRNPDNTPFELNRDAFDPVISRDGRYVAFATRATNIQAPDGSLNLAFGPPSQVYVVNRYVDGNVVNTDQSGNVSISLVSQNASGGFGDGESLAPVISGNGRYIGFRTEAGDLQPQFVTRSDGLLLETFITGVASVSVLNGGADYGPVLDVVGVGTSARVRAVVSNGGRITDVVVLNGGRGYTTAPTITVNDPNGGSGADFEVTVASGAVTGVRVVDGGSGYTPPPSVTIDPSIGGFPATATAVVGADGSLTGVTITDPGSNYFLPPAITIDSVIGSGAIVEANLGIVGAITNYADTNGTSDVYVRDTGLMAIQVTAAGSGYDDNNPPAVTISGGGGNAATAVAIVQNGEITRIDITNPGFGYSSAPTIAIAGGGGATADALLTDGSQRVSRSTFGQQAIGLIGSFDVPSSRSLAMSSDGRYLVFASEAANTAGFIFGKSNQLPLDSNSKRDVFIVDRRVGEFVTPIDGVAPTVTLTMDNGTATFGSSRQVVIRSFDGGDLDSSGFPVPGQIVNVRLYVNGEERVGLVRSGSEGFNYYYTLRIPSLVGPLQVYAIAEDGNGNRTQSASVVVNVVAPTSGQPAVSIAVNPSSISLGQTATIQAFPTDPEGQLAIAPEPVVRFYVDGTQIAADPTNPLRALFTPTYAGEYSINAVVKDATNNTAASNEFILKVLAPPAPVVSWVRPTALETARVSLGQTYFFELDVNTTNSAASIQTVVLRGSIGLTEFNIGQAARVGTTSIYRLAWTPTLPSQVGAVNVRAFATDTQRGEGTSVVRVLNVQNAVGTTPTVTFVAPVPLAGGNSVQVLTTDTTTLRVQVTDDAPVSSIKFYANGSLLGLGSYDSGTGIAEYVVNPSSFATGAYEIVAIVEDASGNTSSTLFNPLQPTVPRAPLLLLVTTPSPAVVINAPVADTSGLVVSRLGQPLIFDIQASSSDIVLQITSVSVVVDGQSVGNATRLAGTNRYTFDWTPTATGNFIAFVSAGDSAGGTARSENLSLRITEAVGSVPTVQIVTAPTTAALGSTLFFAATATDNVNVTSVAFYADNVLLGNATRITGTNNWTLSVASSAQPFASKGAAAYAVTAIATDSDGNRIQSAVSPLTLTSAAPGGGVTTITLAEPTPSLFTLGQATLLSAQVSVPTGVNVASVQFFANGVSVGSATQSPYVLGYTPAATGDYSVFAVVTDSVGTQTVSAARSLTVSPLVGVAPQAVLADNTSVTLVNGSKITFAVQVTPGSSAVQTVQFFLGDTLIGNGSLVAGSNVYSLNYTTTAPIGAYSLYAVVTDANANIVQSNNRPVVVVAGTVPTVRIISPVAGSYDILANEEFAPASARVVTRIANIFGDLDVTGFIIDDAGLNYAPGVRAVMQVFNDPAFGGGLVRTEVLTVTLNSTGGIATLALPGGTDANSGNRRIQYYQSAVVSIEDNFNLQPLAIVVAPTSANGIASVRQFVNGVQIGARSSSPYSFDWRPSRSGSYVLVAEVTDLDGITSSSDPVTVTINPAPEIAPVEVLAEIETAYRKIFGRSPTNEEILAAVTTYGVDVTMAEVAVQLLQSPEFRDDQGELIFIYLSIWGEFPTLAQYNALREQRDFALEDSGIIDGILNSVAYQQRFGATADMTNILSGRQYEAIRAFAIRSYENLNGKKPSGSAANIVAQQFYNSIVNLGATPGNALVNYVNSNFQGAKVGPQLKRMQVAGAILLLGDTQPTNALVASFGNTSVEAIARFYLNGDTAYSAGTVVSFSVATGNEPAGTTFYARGLPSGLRINPNTGEVSGKIASALRAYEFTYWTQLNGVRGSTQSKLVLVKALDDKYSGKYELLLEHGTSGLPAGKVTLTVTNRAAYTGRLVYSDGLSYAFRGTLSVFTDGSAVGVHPEIRRRAPLANLVVGVNFSPLGDLTVTVAEGTGPVLAQASGDSLPTFTSRTPAPWNGNYVVGLSDVSTVNPFFVAPAFTSAGNGRITVSKTGLISVRLVGADKSRITASAAGTANSEYPIYINPYGARLPNSYFAGWVTVADVNALATATFPAAQNELYWQRQAGGTGDFSSGFGPLSIEIDYPVAP